MNNPDLPLDGADGTAMLAAIASGKTCAEAVVRACLARIEAREPLLKAWAWIDGPAALTQARDLDKQRARRPLHGLPIGVKDVVNTRDMPTQHNSPHYTGSRPGLDAACIEVLREAGALIIGKTETVEFAAGGRKALTRNPADLTRTPGGTSSGSAAAVADFHVPLALATQTSGSTIRPASYCGVYALKPSWGVVSREGVKMFANSLDTLTWMARSVRDLRLLAEVFDLPDDTSVRPDAAPLRIGICRTPFWARAEDSTRFAMDEAIVALRQSGAVVTDIDLPAAFAGLLRAHSVVMEGEARGAFLNEYRRHGAALHPHLRKRVENSLGLTHNDLRAAYDLAASCRQAFDEIAAPFDAILTPSSTGVAPLGIDSTGDSTFSRSWSLLHVPCINIPVRSLVRGLPIGLTLTTSRFGDLRLLRVADQVAAVIGGRD
ncbi:amidase [Humitalea sp. 24SJ18S-53]|uniref:amidase n=1 Tax=Humitalea sp. 24SJ18S-53 TaxID=3422307 RepID=UPI003D66BB2A